eukprot:2518841-Rhodomonas_salina.4
MSGRDAVSCGHTLDISRIFLQPPTLYTGSSTCFKSALHVTRARSSASFRYKLPPSYYVRYDHTVWH